MKTSQLQQYARPFSGQLLQDPQQVMTKGTVTIQIPAGGSYNYFTIGQTVVLTGVVTDPSAAGINATATLTVGMPAAVSTVNFDKLYCIDGSTGLATNSTFPDFTILLAAADQYGNSMSNAQCNSDLEIFSSNPSVANINPTVLQKQGPNANELGIQLANPLSTTAIDGTATITLISKSSGKSFTFNVTSTKASQVAKFALQAPATAIAAGDTGVAIPFTALDQFGAAVTDYGTLKSEVLLTPATKTDAGGWLRWVLDPVKNVGVLEYDAPTTANVVQDLPMSLTAVTNTGSGSVSTLTVTVRKLGTPATVSSITSDINSNLTIGATTTIQGNYVNVLDQYNRSFGMNGNFGSPVVNTGVPAADNVTNDTANTGKYRLTVGMDNPKGATAPNANTDASGVLTIAGDASNNGAVTNGVFGLYDIATSYVAHVSAITVTANKLGTAAVDINLQKWVPSTGNTLATAGYWTNVPNSTYTINFVVNEKSNYTGYSVADVGTIADVSKLDPTLQAANVEGNYKPGLTVYGLIGTAKYALNANEYSVVSDSAYVKYISNALVADTTSAVNVTTGADSAYSNGASTFTANLVITINADTNPVVVTKQVTVSNAGASANSISLYGYYTQTGAATHYKTAANDNANQIEINLTPAEAGSVVVDANGNATYTSGTFVGADLTDILNHAVVVDDQYGNQLPLTYLQGANNSSYVVTNFSNALGQIKNVVSGGVTGGNTLFANGDYFTVTYISGAKAFSMKVVVNVG